MFKGRWIEFFQDDAGHLSMTRLLCFLAFFPSSYALIQRVESADVPDALMWFLGAFAGAYVGGKFADAKANAAPSVLIQQEKATNNVEKSG